MAEVLARFSNPVLDGAVVFQAQACGAPMSDGRWTAWIEFIPVDGGQPLRSPRETTQPNRIDAEYWATGLTPVYLEGALQRAQNPTVVRTRTELPEPVFSEPADAILDPFYAYRKGETLLSQQLNALSPWHLVNIIRAYGLSEEPAAVLDQLPAAALVARIVDACKRSKPR